MELITGESHEVAGGVDKLRANLLEMPTDAGELLEAARCTKPFDECVEFEEECTSRMSESGELQLSLSWIETGALDFELLQRVRRVADSALDQLGQTASWLADVCGHWRQCRPLRRDAAGDDGGGGRRRADERRLIVVAATRRIGRVVIQILAVGKHVHPRLLQLLLLIAR